MVPHPSVGTVTTIHPTPGYFSPGLLPKPCWWHSQRLLFTQFDIVDPQYTRPVINKQSSLRNRHEKKETSVNDYKNCGGGHDAKTIPLPAQFQKVFSGHTTSKSKYPDRTFSFCVGEENLGFNLQFNFQFLPDSKSWITSRRWRHTHVISSLDPRMRRRGFTESGVLSCFYWVESIGVSFWRQSAQTESGVDPGCWSRAPNCHWIDAGS